MFSHRRFIQTALLSLFSLLATPAATESLQAQSASAAGTSRTIVVTARIQGRMGEILDIRAVGAPVQLSDGTVEQRYAVVANVAFTMTTQADNRDEIRVTEGGTEQLVSEYVGIPGFHAEIRVRSPAPMSTLVSLLPRLGAAAQSAVSGSGN